MSAITATKLHQLFHQVRYGKNMQIVKIERREEPIPAEPRFSVGNCWECDQPVMASHGQLITQDKYGVSHKKCRKEVSRFGRRRRG